MGFSLRGVAGVRQDARSLPRCLATPLRVARVSRQLNREISQLFVDDKVIQKTLRSFTKSAEMDEIATVTDVVVSGDLQVAKVYISLYDTQGGDASAETWERICKLQPYVRRVIGQRLSLKRTPEVRFVHDRDFEKMHRALELLEALEAEEDLEEGEVSPTTSTLEDMRRERVSGESGVQLWDEVEEDSDRMDDLPDAGMAFADMFPDTSDIRHSTNMRSPGRKR